VAGLGYGSMRSQRFGAGFDLAGSRPYVPGDDVRRIDWRASARRASTDDGDELVVREHLAEVASRVVVAVDRSPRMAMCPPGLPWLQKPEVIGRACALLVETGLERGCRVGYLDEGDGSPAGPFWLPPTGQAGVHRVLEPAIAGREFAAPGDTAERLLRWLVHPARSPAAGTFVFVLSDFLRPPPDEVWVEALARGLDPVPVVIQDPVWELSFPDVPGTVLPLVDAAGGSVRPTRLGRREIGRRQRENEERRARLEAGFDRLGLTAVALGSSEPGAILSAFVTWAESRRLGTRLAR